MKKSIRQSAAVFKTSEETLGSCTHRPPCPGCPRFGEAGIAQGPRHALNDLAIAHGIPAVGVVGGEQFGFRHRARLAIRGHRGSPKVGLFELGTHRVVHIPHCKVHHPLINRVAAIVRRAIVETELTCYSDRAHLGIVRYLQVVVERATQSAQVVIVANADTPVALLPCAELIQARLGQELHSLWLNFNRDPSNKILGPDFHRCAGPVSVVEHFGGPGIHYPPGAFGQNNLTVAQAIVEHIRAAVPHGSKVAEFYAGVGAIGLSVLNQVDGLMLNEINPHALAGLELGLANLDPATREKVSIRPGSADVLYAAAAGADVVIVDPPRKGLDGELLRYLAGEPPASLIYVSCGLESLIRDVEQLTASGTLRLKTLRAFDLMPFTEHVETVAQFERT